MCNQGEGNGEPLHQECCLVYPQGSQGVLETQWTHLHILYIKFYMKNNTPTTQELDGEIIYDCNIIMSVYLGLIFVLETHITFSRVRI